MLIDLLFGAIYFAAGWGMVVRWFGPAIAMIAGDGYPNAAIAIMLGVILFWPGVLIWLVWSNTAMRSKKP